MELINQIITIIIIFLGFPIGIILAKLSPEEMKKGKKYFKVIQTTLMVFILFFLFNYFNLSILISLPITLIVFFLLFYWPKEKSFLFYLILPLIIYFSKINPNLFALQSSLIFIFGLVTGSLSSKVKNKKFISKSKEIFVLIFRNSVFVLLSILSLFI